MSTLSPPAAALDVEEELHLADLVLRPRALRPLLTEAAGVPSDARCQVVDAKYEARSHCTVLYELGPALVTLVVDLGPESPHSASGPGRQLASRMRAFVFPEDPALAQLGAVLDGAAMAELLEGPLGSPVAACRVRLLRYRPGKRATLGVTATLRGGGGRRRRALIAKVYANPSKAGSVYEECGHLASVLAPQVEVVGLAAMVGFLPQVPMVVQASVHGVPLDPLLGAGPAGGVDRRAVGGVAAAGRAMAAVHAAPPLTGRVRSSEAELARFANRAGRIAQVDPSAGAALLEAVEKLAEAHGSLPATPAGLVHGDCKPSQFLLAGRGVAVLDFDHVGRADPAYDLGAFVAALRKADVVEFLAGRRSSGRRSLEQAFLDGYEPRITRHDDLALRVAWHQSAALVRKALRAFARAPRSPVTVALATEAGRCLR